METPGVNWRKATYSTGAQGGGCVEAGETPGKILVRDTVKRDFYTMPIPAEAWRDFTSRVKNDAISLST